MPSLELRATHKPNPRVRKSLISGGTSLRTSKKSKKSEKSKMSNRLPVEFGVKVRRSRIREFQASQRELLVQLAHKTYEPAREKAEERGETMIHSAEKHAIHRSGRAWCPQYKLPRLDRSVTISPSVYKCGGAWAIRSRCVLSWLSSRISRSAF
jgi:hypothetical protein